MKTGFSPFYISFFLFIISFSPQNKLWSQPPQYKMQVYINTWSELAISQMVAHGIPASVTMAQAIFESRCGGSELAKSSNNHFGIKCHLEWRGDTVLRHDDTLYECFRSYKNAEASFEDHSLFLSKRPRYALLFELPAGDYKAWCVGLKEAGYATYETYAEDLIRLIEQTELYKLDGVQELPRKKVYRHEPELKAVRFRPANFDLVAFSQHNLLWTDEMEAHVRSLDLILRKSRATKKS